MTQGALYVRRTDTRRQLFQDVEDRPFPELRRHRAQQEADGGRRSTLLADHLAHIARGYLELDQGDLLALPHGHSHLIRLVHESLGNNLDQLLHGIGASLTSGPLLLPLGWWAAP